MATGPNTGGMAHSPANIVDMKALQEIEEHVFVPTIHALRRANHRSEVYYLRG